MLLSHVSLETTGREPNHADPPHRAVVEVPLDRSAGRLASFASALGPMAAM